MNYEELQELVGFPVNKPADLKAELGMLYYEGRLFKKDPYRSLYWFRLAKKEGSLLAEHMLGKCYLHGTGVKKDIKKGIEILTSLSRRGFNTSTYELALHKYNDYETDSDITAAHSLLLEAAKNGHAESQYKLASICIENDTGSIDKHRVEYWLKEATDSKHVKAYAKLGELYKSGEIVEANYPEAVEWFQQGAFMGHARAQLELAKCFYSGTGVEQDYFRAVKWLRRAKRNGIMMLDMMMGYEDEGHRSIDSLKEDSHKNPNASFIIAARAEFTVMSLEDPIEYYLRAAQEGHPNAQYLLGEAYHYGIETKVDHDQAIIWLDRASRGGHNEAEYLLSLIYLYCPDTSNNLSEAVRLLKSSAKEMNSYACNQLGILFFSGVGVCKNTSKARKYFEKAAETGYHASIHNMLLLKGKDKSFSDSSAQDGLQSLARQHDHAGLSLFFSFLTSTYLGIDYASALSSLRRVLNLDSAKQSLMDLGATHASEIEVPRLSLCLDLLRAGYLVSPLFKYLNSKYGITLCDYLTSIASDVSDKSDNNTTFVYAINHLSLGSNTSCKEYYNILHQAASTGNKYAQFALGIQLQNGLDFAHSFGTSLAWLERAAEQGHERAQYELGYKYLYSEVSSRNYIKAFRWLSSASRSGSKRAQYLLSTIYYDHGKSFMTEEEAFSTLKEAANKCSSAAKLELARQCDDTDSATLEQALYWILRSMECEYDPSFQFLASLLVSNEIAHELPESSIYMLLSAGDTNSSASFTLGYLYYHGVVVNQSYSQAVHHFQAAGNHAQSMFYLGKCYEFGYGITQNLQQSVNLYKASAENGYPPAQYALASCYEAGIGTEKNLSKAKDWFEKARENDYLPT